MGRINAIMDDLDPLCELREVYERSPSPRLQRLIVVLSEPGVFGGDYAFLCNSDAPGPLERSSVASFGESCEVGYITSVSPYTSSTGRQFSRAYPISLEEGARLVEDIAWSKRDRAPVGTLCMPRDVAEAVLAQSDRTVRTSRPRRSEVNVGRAIVSVDGGVRLGGSSTTRKEITDARASKVKC